MKDELITLIEQTNPWLNDPNSPVIAIESLIPRSYQELLLEPEWDSLCTVLVGPRQAGKTTLGFKICQSLIHETKRFDSLLYLNCDLLQVRDWLRSPIFLKEAQEQFNLSKPIVFIDEAQRLESPGLLLKAIVDLKLPIKLIASGSSQLEFKSNDQEFLTGRQIETTVLPLSIQEFSEQANQLVYGSYPGIVRSKQKSILLAELYKNYIKKDIIEILKIGKADVMERLIALLAHSSGQLVNYQQLATDTKLAVLTVQNYLDVLENTYVVKKIKPYVGNKRKEVTANPVYYFVDNGFRNQALANFQGIEERLDAGLLAEGYVFQELYKFETQTRKQLNIHYWRTRSGAEVDFVLDLANQYPLPIEVKFQNFKQAKVSRAFRSFVEAYQPKLGFIVTKDFNAELDVESCTVKFISIKRLAFLFKSLPV